MPSREAEVRRPGPTAQTRGGSSKMIVMVMWLPVSLCVTYELDRRGGEELVDLLHFLHETAKDSATQRHDFRPPPARANVGRRLRRVVGAAAAPAKASPFRGHDRALLRPRHFAQQERIARLDRALTMRRVDRSRRRCEESDRLEHTILGEIGLRDLQRPRRIELALEHMPPLEGIRDYAPRHRPPVPSCLSAPHTPPLARSLPPPTNGPDATGTELGPSPNPSRRLPEASPVD